MTTLDHVRQRLRAVADRAARSDIDGMLGMGHCSPSQNYLDHNQADLDSDGCITLVDYQIWLECYRQANGCDFVPPGGKKPTSLISISMATFMTR